MMRLYCIYDLEQKKADAIFTFDNDIVAKRYFRSTMKQPAMHDCAKEFELRYLAEFDEKNLEFLPELDSVLIESGVDVYMEGEN